MILVVPIPTEICLDSQFQENEGFLSDTDSQTVLIESCLGMVQLEVPNEMTIIELLKMLDETRAELLHDD